MIFFLQLQNRFLLAFCFFPSDYYKVCRIYLTHVPGMDALLFLLLEAMTAFIIESRLVLY